MRIYPAYLYKDKAKWTDISKLIEELFELKKKFAAYCGDKIMSEDYSEGYPEGCPLKEYFDERGNHFKFIKRINEDSKSVENGRGYDCSCNVVVYFHQNKIVVHEFSGWIAKNFLKENFKYPDYSYYDIYAGDEDITPEMEKDFGWRREFYDSLFDTTGTPSNVGLSYDFFNDSMTAIEITRYIRNSLKGETK